MLTKITGANTEDHLHHYTVNTDPDIWADIRITIYWGGNDLAEQFDTSFRNLVNSSVYRNTF